MSEMNGRAGRKERCDTARYRVRTLSAGEIPMLTALFDYADVDEMIAENTKAVENGRIDIFVLFAGDRMIGELRAKYVCDDSRFAEAGKRAYLYAFRILPDCQGRGLGSFLLESVLSSLAENGYREFTVGVEDDNARARYLYEKNGFTEFVARMSESYQGCSYEYDLLLKRA